MTGGLPAWARFNTHSKTASIGTTVKHEMSDFTFIHTQLISCWGHEMLVHMLQISERVKYTLQGQHLGIINQTKPRGRAADKDTSVSTVIPLENSGKTHVSPSWRATTI